jgi:hypothetical protein
MYIYSYGYENRILKFLNIQKQDDHSVYTSVQLFYTEWKKKRIFYFWHLIYMK